MILDLSVSAVFDCKMNKELKDLLQQMLKDIKEDKFIEWNVKVSEHIEKYYCENYNTKIDFSENGENKVNMEKKKQR